MKNALLKTYLFFWVLLGLFAMPVSAAPISLNFTSDGGGAWADGIAEDGEGGSANIPWITMQVLNITDVAGTNSGTIIWKDSVWMSSSDPGYSGLTWEDNTGTKGMAIKSSDGSEFQINGFKYYNWGETVNTTVTIKGYRNSVEVASTSFQAYDPGYTPMNISLDSTFDYVDDVRLYISAGGYKGTQAASHHSINNIVIDDPVVPAPTITSSTYNTATGALEVTGTNFTETAGLANDVVATKFTLTGEGGSTHTLTDTSNAELGGSTTSFTLTLSATDKAAVNLIINKTGTQATGGTNYNLAGAAGFIADSAATADATSTVNATVTAPTVTSATYDASTGVLAVTGADLKKLSGAANEIIANKFTFTGEGGSTYPLSDTANVEITSGTSFSLTLSATDKAGVNLLLNKNGTSSTGATTYNLAAADDWNAGADAAVNIADLTGNGVTVSNVAVPTITSATYNASTGVLVITGTGLLKLSNANNDIVANKFTLTGQGSSTYTLTDTANVEITSGTAFTLTLSATDKTAVDLILNKNGTSSIGGTTYNLAAAEDWAAGADAAVVVADLTGNGITASNVPSAPDAPTIGTATAGDGQASVTFSAPGSNGGAAITTYTATASPGGAFGTCAGPAACTATVTGLSNGTAYTFTVTATNAVGTSVASGASNSATPKGNQTITFTNPGAQNFGTSPTLTATADSATGTDNLTVTFSSSTTGVCTITSGGALTFVTAGSCTIDADQAGDAATNAAPTVSRTFTVNAVVPGAPTIGTATAGNTQATVAFTAPASLGGAAITGYTVTASPGGATGTGAGSPITVTGLTNGVAYTFTVTATNSAGTGSASAASNSITPASPQTITFANPGAQNFGTTPTLTASSSAGAGYVVTFTSSTTGVCTVSGVTLTFLAAGTCTINADQAGDSSYLPASQVSRSFSVNPVVPGAPTIGTAIAGDTQASVAFVAPVNIGGSAITGYTVTVNPADVAPVSGAASPIVVTGLTNGVAYTFTVTADNVAGTSPASGASNSITPAATQTITFANPGAQTFGTSPTLTATSDSGLTPTFTSSTTGVCTITTGGALTFVTAGTCTINADQAGNGSYLAATQVTRSFTVNAVAPGIPAAPTATAGDASATVSFSAPASNGGSAITAYTVVASPGGATATGAVSPLTVSGLANGTAYTFTVLATNVAGSSAASAASNAVTPAAAPTNEAPVITQGSSASGTVAEDAVFALSLSATDADNDPLSWSISGNAANGSAAVAGGSVSYTPTANFNGSDSFVVEVSDGELSASINVSVTVTPLNDAPTISGTPDVTLDQDTAYSFTPTAADVDSADVLTFSISNKPDWASFNTTTGALTGTPAGTDTGKTSGIVISVSDGTTTVSLPAFDLEVIATVDPLQPVVTAPADIEINATALYTPLTLRQLLSLADNVSQEQLEQILKGMASDGVSGNACCTAMPEGLNANNILLLPPGRHQVSWKATNAVGVSGTATQLVQVKPLVSLSKSQVALRGSDVELRVILNGDSPQYPLTVPFSIDEATTATAAEYQVTMSEAVFTEPGQLEVVIPVKLNAVAGSNDSQLIFSLGAGSNNGAASRHVIDIRQGNVAPVVSLNVSQNGVTTGLVTPNGGPVTVSTSVADLNSGDSHTFDWSATKGLPDIDGNNTDAGRSFDPSALTGSYAVSVSVTDSAGAVVSAQAYFRVVASLPVLSVDNDTDQDGINDVTEGAGDTDGNGIPDYLDNMPSANILPQQGNTTNAYLIECDPGVRCGLGLFARGGSSGGVQIRDEEIGTLRDLIVDPAFEPVGGVFDFNIRDLPTPGQSVRVVIPQIAPIPAGAVYRKYQQGQWRSFAEDANNALHSAPGNPGYCPPPGTADWTPGLTAGHLCVQLTIEDGGANDDDGLVNSAVVDPGAVSVYFNTAPVAVNDSASTDDRTAISINVLANDKDVDNDALTVIAATAQQGSVSIEAGNVLRYTPKTGFSGIDTVNYRIRDIKGGEAAAVLSVSVTAYQNVVTEGKSSGGSGSIAALLSLVMLVLWRRISLVLVAMVAGHASAADIYLQLGAGQSSASAPTVTLPAGSNLTVDDTDTAYQFVAGYQLLDGLAIEAGYQQLGDGTAALTGSTLNPPSYQQLALAATPVLGDGISAGVRWQFLRVADWRFELPVGMLRWKADLNSTLGNSTVADEVDGTDWYAGVALNYQLSTNFGAGLSYQHIDLAPGGVQQYLLTVRYQF